MSEGAEVEPRRKNMDRWLGDGGMPVIEALGGSFERYGPQWCEGSWVPTDLACNPHGIVQAGVHNVVLDAAMNFAINAGLSSGDRTKATLEMKGEYLTAARSGQPLRFRGTVTREARQVAFAEARIEAEDGTVVSKATGTFLLHRSDP